MNKDQLVTKIAEQTGLKKSDALAALNATLDNIEATLTKGDKVVLSNFGTFSVSYRAPRTGVVPGTTNKIAIDGKVAVKFKAGKELVETANNKTLKNKLLKKTPAAK